MTFGHPETGYYIAPLFTFNLETRFNKSVIQGIFSREKQLLSLLIIQMKKKKQSTVLLTTTKNVGGGGDFLFV